MDTDDLMKTLPVRTTAGFTAKDHAQLLKLYWDWQSMYGDVDGIKDQSMTLELFDDALQMQCIDLHV